MILWMMYGEKQNETKLSVRNHEEIIDLDDI